MNLKPEQIPDEVVEAAMRAEQEFYAEKRYTSFSDIGSTDAHDVMKAALAAALPVLLGEPVGRVIDGFHDALGGSVHVAEWTRDEPPLGAILYTLPTQDTPNADK